MLKFCVCFYHSPGSVATEKPVVHYCLVVYHESVTGFPSPGIVYRQSAINNKLAPKPVPKRNPNPTLTPP